MPSALKRCEQKARHVVLPPRQTDESVGAPSANQQGWMAIAGSRFEDYQADRSRVAESTTAITAVTSKTAIARTNRTTGSRLIAARPDCDHARSAGLDESCLRLRHRRRRRDPNLGAGRRHHRRSLDRGRGSTRQDRLGWSSALSCSVTGLQLGPSEGQSQSDRTADNDESPRPRSCCVVPAHHLRSPSSRSTSSARLPTLSTALRKAASETPNFAAQSRTS